jgi:hypothetical protein
MCNLVWRSSQTYTQSASIFKWKITKMVSQVPVNLSTLTAVFSNDCMMMTCTCTCAQEITASVLLHLVTIKQTLMNGGTS